MASQRPDSVIEKESLADLQWVVANAAGKKEIVDSQLVFYQKKVEALTGKIKTLRYDFQSFLISNGMDVNYPVFAKVMNDDTLMDTSPVNGLTAIDIEKARTRNFPQESMQTISSLLVSKYLTIMSTIEDYSSKLYALRFEKARMVHLLDQAVSIRKDYSANVSAASTANDGRYLELKAAYENLNNLLRALVEFKHVFVIVPDPISSKTVTDTHASNIDRYNVYYAGKKKFIAKMFNNLADAFSELEHPELSSEFFVGGLQAKATIFAGEDIFPSQYIRAIDKKDNIILIIDGNIQEIVDMINRVKDMMEEIRGTKGGIGNSDLKELITISSQLVKASVNAENIDRITTEQVTEQNKLTLNNVIDSVDKFKDKLQGGVEKLDEAFKKANAWALRNVANVIGFIFPNRKTGKDSLRDNVREMVRRKYGGNVPFTDEVVIKDVGKPVRFVRITDFDETTGEEKDKSLGKQLGEAIVTVVDKNILAK